MKGLILLFITVAASMVGWGYCDQVTRNWIKKVIRKNLLPIIVATLFVTLAILFSVNATLRLV